MNLTDTERAWFYWGLFFAVLVGAVLGLGFADWTLVPR